MEAASNIMALYRPKTDRPRQLPKSRFWPRLFSLVSLSSIAMAPVAALSLWLLMSDPVTAAAVMEQGSLFPVLYALAKVVGKTIASMLAML
jgi:hypothetical protein